MTNLIKLTQNENYIEGLQTVLRLSRLFSDSKAAPFIHYRVSENLYCQFIEGSTNLSREDIAIDAKTEFLNNETMDQSIIGIGIKTFLHKNGNTLQKIAEFNKDKPLYDNLSLKKKILKISELRNIRLNFCKNTHDLTDLNYHCVTRDGSGKIRIYNTPMECIDTNNINSISISDSSIFFNDGINEYSFNLSKSTLFKRFKLNELKPVSEFEVEIDEDPLELLVKAFQSQVTSPAKYSTNKDYVILPLYSYSSTRGKFVPEKSALNIWNAAGRVRNLDEAYISIPKKIHCFLNEKYDSHRIKFFPNRDTPFQLELPNNEQLIAKLCQSDSKALMTNPNSDLGNWILRKVLNISQGEILTYDRLLELGVDSVKITQEDVSGDNLMYSIDFCPIGSYDEFVLRNNI